MRAALTEARRRTRTAACIGITYLHLVDSLVTLGVLSKKRSSSHKLHCISRELCAIELASGNGPVFAYVRSARNPADAPSRKRRLWLPGKGAKRANHHAS